MVDVTRMSSSMVEKRQGRKNNYLTDIITLGGLYADYYIV